MHLYGGTLLIGSGGDLSSTTLVLDHEGGELDIGNVTQLAVGGLQGNQDLSLINDLGQPVSLLYVTYRLANTPVNFGGSISGNGASLTFQGSNATLSGNSTFTGGTVLQNDAIVQFTSSTNFGTGSIVFGPNGTFATGGGTLVYAPGNQDDISSHTIIFNRTGPADINTNGNDVTFAHSIGNGGGGSFTKDGNGMLTLLSSTNYTGNTSVAGGALVLATPDAVTGNISLGEGNLILQDVNSLRSAVLASGALAGHEISFGTLTPETVAGFSGQNNGDVALTNDLGQGVSFVIGLNNSTQISSATITGNGSVTVTGNGTQTLAGNSTYLGATTIDHATLNAGFGNFPFAELANGGNVSAIGASGNAAENLVINGGTLNYFGGVAASTDRGFTLGIDGGTLAYAIKPVSFTNSAPIAMIGTDVARTLTLNAGTIGPTGLLASAITDDGAGATTVVKTGAGAWALTGNNTFTGELILAGGFVTFSALQNLGENMTIDFNAGGIRYDVGTTLDLSLARTLYFEVNGGSIDTNGNNVTFDGSIGGGGPGGLVKVGAGTLTVNGSVFYSGNTTLDAGTLAVGGNGSLAASPAIVFQGGNLDVSAWNGNFTVNANQSLVVALSGAHNIIGGLTILGTLTGNSRLLSFNQDLNFGPNAVVNVQVGGNTRGSLYGAFNVGGNLTLGGTLTVSFSPNFVPPRGSTFQFFQVTGSRSGSFTSLVLPNINANLGWDTSQLYTAGTIAVQTINFVQWVGVVGLNGSNAQPLARPFGGLANAIRYAMNLDTSAAPANSPLLGTAVINGVNYLTLQYRARKNMTDYQLVPQFSTDLVTWTNVDAGNITQLADDDVYTSRYQASAPLPPNGSVFLRVVAEPLP